MRRILRHLFELDGKITSRGPVYGVEARTPTRRKHIPQVRHDVRRATRIRFVVEDRISHERDV